MKRGTTLECFEDLIKRLEVHDDFFEKRQELARVIGVESKTIKRWIVGSTTPYGESMIGLRAYLDFLGYEVEEFMKLPGILQDSARLLAFHIVTLDEMITLSEFDSSHLLSILRGVRGVSKEREEKFVHMVNAYRDDLTKAQATVPRLVELEKRLGQDKVEAVRDVQAQPIVPLATVPISDHTRDEHFKYLTLMLLDHARYYTRSELPDEVREHLRSVVGQRNIFELKNLLVRLCGNTAFKQTQP